MKNEKNLLAPSEARPPVDAAPSLTHEQRQFAAVLGDLLAEQWLTEQATRREVSGSINLGQPIALPERP